MALLKSLSIGTLIISGMSLLACNTKTIGEPRVQTLTQSTSEVDNSYRNNDKQVSFKTYDYNPNANQPLTEVRGRFLRDNNCLVFLGTYGGKSIPILPRGITKWDDATQSLIIDGKSIKMGQLVSSNGIARPSAYDQDITGTCKQDQSIYIGTMGLEVLENDSLSDISTINPKSKIQTYSFDLKKFKSELYNNPDEHLWIPGTLHRKQNCFVYTTTANTTMLALFPDSITKWHEDSQSFTIGNKSVKLGQNISTRTSPTLFIPESHQGACNERLAIKITPELNLK